MEDEVGDGCDGNSPHFVSPQFIKSPKTAWAAVAFRWLEGFSREENSLGGDKCCVEIKVVYFLTLWKSGHRQPTSSTAGESDRSDGSTQENTSKLHLIKQSYEVFFFFNNPEVLLSKLFFLIHWLEIRIKTHLATDTPPPAGLLQNCLNVTPSSLSPLPPTSSSLVPWWLPLQTEGQ